MRLVKKVRSQTRYVTPTFPARQDSIVYPPRVKPDLCYQAINDTSTNPFTTTENGQKCLVETSVRRFVNASTSGLFIPFSAPSNLTHAIESRSIIALIP